MERELWPISYHELREAANDFRQKYVQIPAWVLVAVSLWAALHDRPVGCEAAAVRDADGHRAEVRQRDLVRRRTGAVVGVGAPAAPGPHLGLGQGSSSTPPAS